MENNTKFILGFTGLSVAAAAAYYFFVYRKSTQQATQALQTISQAGASIQAAKPTTPYPSQLEMLQAANQGKWDPNEPGAIANSYDPNTGHWQRGDWSFQVTSLRPIKAKANKGSETFLYTSTVNSEAVNSSLNGFTRLLR